MSTKKVSLKTQTSLIAPSNERSHTMPYSCKHCGKKYATKFNHRVHEDKCVKQSSHVNLKTDKRSKRNSSKVELKRLKENNSKNFKNHICYEFMDCYFCKDQRMSPMKINEGEIIPKETKEVEIEKTKQQMVSVEAIPSLLAEPKKKDEDSTKIEISKVTCSLTYPYENEFPIWIMTETKISKEKSEIKENSNKVSQNTSSHELKSSKERNAEKSKRPENSKPKQVNGISKDSKSKPKSSKENSSKIEPKRFEENNLKDFKLKSSKRPKTEKSKNESYEDEEKSDLDYENFKKSLKTKDGTLNSPTPTQYLPTPTQYSQTPTEYVPTPAEYSPTPTEYLPSPTQLLQTPTEYLPTPTEYLPTNPEYSPTPINPYSPTHPEYSPTYAEYSPTPLENLPTYPEYSPMPILDRKPLNDSKIEPKRKKNRRQGNAL